MSSDAAGRCAVCGATSAEAIFEGPIRSGRFGVLTDTTMVVACTECGAQRLSQSPSDTNTYYETTEYREETNRDPSASHYCQEHDSQQIDNLRFLGPEKIRSSTIVDVGCGAGSFLDSVVGLAASAVAVEPSADYREHLARRGYRTFAYIEDALSEMEGAADVVTCFSVIEHVADPAAIVAGMGSLLRPGGRLVISTPNSRDILLELLPDAYPSFFYRKAHLHYLDAVSMTRLVTCAGFDDVRIHFHQRFGLSNAMRWLRDRQPSGDARAPGISATMDAVWKTELQSSGRSDYLYVEAVKGLESR